jgi:hypothetical protein
MPLLQRHDGTIRAIVLIDDARIFSRSAVVVGLYALRLWLIDDIDGRMWSPR